jgi:hypothetical protein
MDNLARKQFEFHHKKASQLQREWESRKAAGEKRLKKMQDELQTDLNRISDQIRGHLDKANQIESQTL